MMFSLLEAWVFPHANIRKGSFQEVNFVFVVVVVVDVAKVVAYAVIFAVDAVVAAFADVLCIVCSTIFTSVMTSFFLLQIRCMVTHNYLALCYCSKKEFGLSLVASIIRNTGL